MATESPLADDCKNCDHSEDQHTGLLIRPCTVRGCRCVKYERTGQ